MLVKFRLPKYSGRQHTYIYIYTKLQWNLRIQPDSHDDRCDGNATVAFLLFFLVVKKKDSIPLEITDDTSGFQKFKNVKNKKKGSMLTQCFTGLPGRSRLVMSVCPADRGVEIIRAAVNSMFNRYRQVLCLTCMVLAVASAYRSFFLRC